MMRGLTAMLEKHHERPHPRRGRRERRQALAPLHHRPAAARQVASACSTRPAPAWRSARTPIPPAVEDCRREIEHLERRDRHPRARDAPPAPTTTSGSTSCSRAWSRPRRALAELEKRWEEEKKRVDEIRELRGKIEASTPSTARRDRRRPLRRRRRAGALQAELDAKTERAAQAPGRGAADAGLRRLARRSPRSSPAGPASRSARWWPNEIQTVLNLKDKLEERVIGQSHALEAIAQRIRTVARQPDRPAAADRRLPAGRPQRRRQDRDRPGPGRHPLRRRAEPDHDQHVRVPGGAHGLEPQGLAAGLRRLRRGRRAHRGRPPQALQRRPARRGREGPPRRAWSSSSRSSTRARSRTAKGGEIDFKNTIILLTSNVGTDTIMKLCADPDTQPRRPTAWPRPSGPTC